MEGHREVREYGNEYAVNNQQYHSQYHPAAAAPPPHPIPFNEYDWTHLHQSIRLQDIHAFRGHYGRLPTKEELRRFEAAIMQVYEQRGNPDPGASSSSTQLASEGGTEEEREYERQDHEDIGSARDTPGSSSNTSPPSQTIPEGISWSKNWDRKDINFICKTLVDIIAETHPEIVKSKLRWRIRRTLSDMDAAKVLLGDDEQRRSIASRIKMNNIKAPVWFLQLSGPKKAYLLTWYSGIHNVQDEAARTFLYRCTSETEARFKLQMQETEKQLREEIKRRAQERRLALEQERQAQ